jgi:MerR family transcriptional regulator, copper efflux regulator
MARMMRITEAARRLGTSPRMLRYRESLGLLPLTTGGAGAAAGSHRRFGEPELRAVSLALEIEQRYGVGPAELAFAVRAVADPLVRAQVRELGERLGRITAPPTRALDFEQQKAQRLLRVRPPR